MPGVRTSKEEEKEPFLLHLRTALYTRLMAHGNGDYVLAASALAAAPVPTVDPQGEDPFEIRYMGNAGIGIRITHSKNNTTLNCLGFSPQSLQMLLMAMNSLKAANRERPQINGMSTQTHYELTFDLHVESLDQLPDMLKLAFDGNVNITEYYLNGVTISAERIENAKIAANIPGADIAGFAHRQALAALGT